MTARDMPEHVRANLRAALRNFIHEEVIPVVAARWQFESDVQADIDDITKGGES